MISGKVGLIMNHEKEWTWRDTGNMETALRAFNAFGALFGLDRGSFKPEQLITAAQAKCGFDDFGDGRFREGLDVICDSYRGEARFNLLGRITAQRYLVDLLVNRLRIIDWAKRHPDVGEQKVRRPWIVIGLPRSGTTLASTLIDLDTRTRSPLSWEVDAPIPPATLATRYSDPRIAQSARVIEQTVRIMPSFPAIHHLDSRAPHECIMLLRYDFRSLALQALALCPSYGKWYVGCDMGSAFALHKTILQIWQSEIATRYWNLKAPNHLHHIDDLMAAYPDARVIWMHRDPAICVPSITSLMMTMQRPMSKAADPAASGAHFNWMYRTGIERTMRYDDQSADSRWCYHLHYDALMRDPVGALRAAYAHFGDEIEPEHEARMAAWVRQRPKNTFGRHKYSPEDFGLRADALHAQYRDYIDRYSVALEL